MASVKKYTITPLKFDQKLVDDVMHRRARGESIAKIAKALNMGLGKTAMQEIIGTSEHTHIDDPAKLARAITKDRKAGKGWAQLAARYGVTEGTVRAAYTAATGRPWNELDYRRGSRKAA
jgi:hypothetical protein